MNDKVSGGKHQYEVFPWPENLNMDLEYNDLHAIICSMKGGKEYLDTLDLACPNGCTDTTLLG
jgi:hypothetical protein